jgi:hypothetical protein
VSDTVSPRLLHFFDRLNPLIVGILRSRLHWLLSPGLMAVTVTGRRTGRRYTIPVGYCQLDDAIVVMTSEARKRNWWRNYLEPRPIELVLRGREVRGTAEVLRATSEEFRQRANQNFRRAAFIPRIFGIEYDARTGLRDEQVKQLADYAAIVRIEPDTD